MADYAQQSLSHFESLTKPKNKSPKKMKRKKNDNGLLGSGGGYDFVPVIDKRNL